MAFPRGPFDPAPLPLASRALPGASVILGSMITLVPVIAHVALLPPFGYLMFLAWRLHRRDALPFWGPLALGLFDDLLSGQPFGFAILLWTATFLAIDMLDDRLASRNFWRDWPLAGGVLAVYLLIGRLVAVPLGAHVDLALLVQIVLSIAVYPVIAWIVAGIDGYREQP